MLPGRRVIRSRPSIWWEMFLSQTKQSDCMYLASRFRGDRHAVCWSHGYIILGPRRSPIDLFFFLTNLRWQIVSCWEKGVVRLAQYRYGARLNSSTGKSPFPPGISRALMLPNFDLISEEITCSSKEIHVYA